LILSILKKNQAAAWFFKIQFSFNFIFS